MKTKIALPTNEEIEHKRRMRLLSAFIKGLAQSASDVVKGHATEIRLFMDAHGFEYSDLVALRNRPYHYDPFHAAKWEWFLRRTMNNFSAILTQ